LCTKWNASKGAFPGSTDDQFFYEKTILHKTRPVPAFPDGHPVIFQGSPSEKTGLIFAFRQPFFGPDDPEYVAKTKAVERPLTAIWRGGNRPYFGKRDEDCPYSPQEMKRRE